MANNNERWLYSAEGGIFSILAADIRKECQFDIVLKAYSGDHWSCHRIGRESKSMEHPTLTMCLCVQPDVIREIGQINARRQDYYPASYMPCNQPSGIDRGRHETITPILRSNTFCAYQVINGYSLAEKPMIIKLNPDAQRIWDNYYNSIERSMRPSGELAGIADWGSKLPGMVGRIAALLHIAEHGKSGLSIPISAGIAGACCKIGTYYKKHALAAFKWWEEIREKKNARIILDYWLHINNTFKGKMSSLLGVQ